ncbi:hypothetical protein PG994_013948 [Apiospora phragmitis]|uniref:Gamma-butyrobetaine dioxygenase n=1 Tax=Apiospora phragmitis TaxID=2905665 RepID=A0ABR1T4H0_9PEZI
MARPIRLPRVLASRPLIPTPVHVSRSASRLVPASHHLATCLTTQKRLISQNLPTSGSASQQNQGLDRTIEPKPHEGPGTWDVVEVTGNTVTLTLTHRACAKPRLLHRHWLRDSCECSACVDIHSGQKKFGTTDVPLDLPISSCRKTSNGSLEIVWENDFLASGRESHTSSYSPEQVSSFFFKPKKFDFPPVVLWDKKTINEDLMFVDYHDWMNDDEVLGAGVKMLHIHGIMFIRNAPDSETAVIDMSSRIGNLKETLYGRTWDVRSKPEAENVAYTSSFLGLHQDMLYLRDPPRLQLLHCLENSCEGGESLFSDAKRAAFLMKIGPPELREALRKQFVTYHYKKHGHHYENAHRIIDDSGQVRWSPPFQAPLRNHKFYIGGSREWHQSATAAIKFQQLLEHEDFLLQYKMKRGDCVIFDNLRVVHGRRAFDTSAGSRWLKGTYNANDVFMSKLRTVCADRPAGAGLPAIPEVGQAIKLNSMYGIWEKTPVQEKPWSKPKPFQIRKIKGKPIPFQRKEM